MTDSINILSYNVSWEAMSSAKKGTGSVPGSIKCVNGTCKKNVYKLIQKAIHTHNVSIFGSQETGDLSTDLPSLFTHNYNAEMLLRGNNEILSVISFNDNYINITQNYFIKDHLFGHHTNSFGFDKRMHQIIVLKHISSNYHILFINLHHPHQTDIQDTLDSIMMTMELNKSNNNYKKINKIIITGDFNTNIINKINKNISYQVDSGLTLLGKKLSVYTLLNTTCCDGDLNGKYWDGDRRDNILTYGFDEGKVIQLIEPKDHVLHSDHLPVIVSLPLSINKNTILIDDKILKLGVKVNIMNKTGIFEDISKDKDEIVKLIEN